MNRDPYDTAYDEDCPSLWQRVRGWLVRFFGGWR